MHYGNNQMYTKMEVIPMSLNKIYLTSGKYLNFYKWVLISATAEIHPIAFLLEFHYILETYNLCKFDKYQI